MSDKGKHSKAGANNKNNKRHPYSAPSLKVFGSVGVLTQAGAGSKVEGSTGRGAKSRRS
jgi:hypothetical protein